MKFPNSYFEDEVREGFLVPAMVKKAWAAELEVLEEIDRICKKHNIKYFMDCGSLLATVRHEGFVPWDDDLDIGMLRDDYIKFLEVAPKEFEEGFETYSYYNHEDFWMFMARVVGKSRICFEDEHLKRFHEFPYIAGIDIFVWDYVPRNEEIHQKRQFLVKYLIAVADGYGEGTLEDLEESLSQIEEASLALSNSKDFINTNIRPIKIPRDKKGDELRRFLYSEAEYLFGIFKEEDSDYLTQIYPISFNYPDFKISKKAFDILIELPYENTEVPVPLGYDEILFNRYGDYMTIRKNIQIHDYPFFESQHKELLEVLDFQIPEFKYENSLLRENTSLPLTDATYKSLVAESVAELERIALGMVEIGNSAIGQDQLAEIAAEGHQLAIDLGTLIETYKLGTDTVGLLEEYCELMYVASKKGVGEISDKIKINVKQLISVSGKEIVEKNAVVFLITKFDYWDSLEAMYQEKIADINNEVYVVSLPRYYKRYDGSFLAECIDETRPEGVNVIDYRSIDLELLHPEEIIFINPFDQWHSTTSVPAEFYSDKLQQMCDKLTYVCPYEIDDFVPEHFCEYKNMDYYVTMPGVLRADEICVGSNILRNTFIEKLTGFAGEDTREAWAKKVRVVSRENVEVKASKADEKKKVVYYLGPTYLVVHGEKGIEKIKESLEIFEKRNTKSELMFYPHPDMNKITKAYAPKIWERYCQIGCDEIIVSESEKELTVIGDAFYGDSGRLANEFRRLGKPVMLQDVYNL